MSAEQIVVLYLPAGRVAQHLPLPAGPDGVPQTPDAWALDLVGGCPPEGTVVAVVPADTGLCGPPDPPPDAHPPTR